MRERVQRLGRGCGECVRVHWLCAGMEWYTMSKQSDNECQARKDGAAIESDRPCHGSDLDDIRAGGDAARVRGLHSSTCQLNVSAFGVTRGIYGVFGECLRRGWKGCLGV